MISASSKEEFFTLLKNKLRRPQLLQLVGTKCSQLTQKKIHTEIENNTISMPRKLGKKKLQLRKKSPPKEETVLSESQVIRMIEEQKQITLDKLHSLDRRYNDLVVKKRAKSLKGKERFVSNLTKEDRKRLRELVQDNKRYEDELSKKTRILREMMASKREEEMKEKDKEIEKIRNERKQMVLKKLKSMQLKAKQRIEFFQKSKELQKEIKEKKYLYELHEDQEYVESQKKEEKQRKIFDEIRERYRFDINDIREHSLKYDKIVEENRQRTENRSIVTENSGVRRAYEPNHFRLMVKNRLEQEKVEEYQRLNYGHQQKDRMFRYQGYILDEFRPKESKKSKFVPHKHTNSAQTLSSVARREKGIEYLEMAKKLKDQEKQKERRRKQAQMAPQFEPYRDYMKDLKINEYETDEQEFASLTKKGRSVSDYEVASKALLLAEKLDTKKKQLNDQKLYNSVKHKLDILNVLE